MGAPAAPASASRWIPDHVAVVGMLTATALAILLVTALFSVLKRFSRQGRREEPAFVVTRVRGPAGTGGIGNGIP